MCLISESRKAVRAGNWDVATALACEAMAGENPAGGYAQLASIHHDRGNYIGMASMAEEGLQHYPSNISLRQIRGLARLGRGEWSGWKDLHGRGEHGNLVRECPKPEWDGYLGSAKSIMVIGEEGFGDQIMWSRFFPWFAKRFGRVMLKPPDELSRLMRNSFPGIDVIDGPEDLKGEFPQEWIGMGSICEHVKLVDGLRPPYLRVRDADRERFAEYFEPRGGRLRVALTWQGQRGHVQDRQRSIGFSAFSPLLDIPGIDFYAFQFGDASDENDRIPCIASVCRDFADTAAALRHIDLLISIDTSIVHVAAALAKPVWVILNTPTDWRWGIPEERNDWYGTVWQFRNRSMEDLAAALTQYARTQGSH
jgi:hypothetical protein